MRPDVLANIFLGIATTFIVATFIYCVIKEHQAIRKEKSFTIKEKNYKLTEIQQSIFRVENEIGDIRQFLASSKNTPQMKPTYTEELKEHQRCLKSDIQYARESSNVVLTSEDLAEYLIRAGWRKQ